MWQEKILMWPDLTVRRNCLTSAVVSLYSGLE